MAELAGTAAEGLLCSQAGIPPQAASRAFLDGFKAKFNKDPILYSPFTYDATNLLIESMKKANSADPGKYLPELAKISFRGATGAIAFDEKGDRKNAEITIFTLKGNKVEPIAIVQGGKTVPYNDFIKQAEAAMGAAVDAAKQAGEAAATAVKDAATAAGDAAKAAADSVKK
jgi:branched-chain amino acid transport system substrate-binding protein